MMPVPIMHHGLFSSSKQWIAEEILLFLRDFSVVLLLGCHKLEQRYFKYNQNA